MQHIRSVRGNARLVSLLSDQMISPSIDPLSSSRLFSFCSICLLYLTSLLCCSTCSVDNHLHSECHTMGGRVRDCCGVTWLVQNRDHIEGGELPSTSWLGTGLACSLIDRALRGFAGGISSCAALVFIILVLTLSIPGWGVVQETVFSSGSLSLVASIALSLYNHLDGSGW